MTDLDLLLAAADSVAPPRPGGDATTPSLYQERLWRAHLAAPATAYSVPCVFDLEGEDTDRVVAAALAVLRAQEVFDTRIADTDGGAFTLVAAGPITPEYFDVDVSTIDRASEELVQRAWASGPLVRLGVLRCAGGADRIALVFHHAVIDGHSVSLLIGEIARELRDPGSAAHTSRPRYRDSASTRTESANWWREYLSTVRHDEVWRPAAGGSSVVTRSAIAAVGSQDAATWLTAVIVTLSRLLNARTLCVSVPLANRREVEDFDVIGPLVSTVPLVVEVDDRENFGELHRRVARILGDATDHADVDLAGVLTDLRRDAPEFWLPADIFVNIQSADRSTIALGAGIARPVAVHTGEMKAPLTVSISATNNPEVQIESVLPGWSAVTHEGVRDVLQAVISAAASTAEPETAVGSVRIGAVGAPASPSTTETSLVDAISGAEGASLRAPDRTLDHTQLVTEITSKAALLAEHGVAAGDCVLVSVERDAAFVTWAAAVMALGAAYVPVDTHHGAARIASIAEQCGARVGVLADATHAPEGLHILDRSAPTAEADIPLTQVNPELPAYVIFTSGTTGAPKGVPVTHANVLALRDATTSLIGPTDVVSAVHAFTFDYSVWEIWTALSRGARVVIYDEATVRDPFTLAERLHEDGVTVLSLTNTALGSLLAARPDLSTVRRLILGGEQVSSAYVRHVLDAAGQVTVVNMLGATETTVHTTRRYVTSDDLRMPTVQVGGPLEHLDVVVVDESVRALPRGVDGQIAVRGAGLALGYLGRGALTAARFVPDPFPGAAPGGRLYLSGDLGRWLAPEELHVEGRIDSQVKVRGHRIETAGVEAVLERLPGVRRACVIARENRLLAFVDALDDARDDEDLRAAAAKKLAAYEVPDRIHRVRAFPVTVNGKLDRSIEALLAAAGNPVVAPSTPAHRPVGSLSAALAAALGDRIVDADRSFLANGGDSILAVKLVTELRSRGIDLGVGDVLGADSIRSLEHVVAAVGAASPLADVSVEPFALIDDDIRDSLPLDVSDAYPLSAAQEGMLFHIRADTRVGVYHNTVSVRIRGGLDPLAFRVALADTMRRHEVLRTSIDEWSALEPLQLVHRHVSTPLTVVTVGDGDDPDAIIDDLVARERTTPFDLARAPLFRITLVRVAPGENQLIVSDSHVVLDGWSWTSTLAEIIGRHNALQRRDPDYDASITPLPVRFVDFVAAEQMARRSHETSEAWASHLRGVRPMLIADTRSAGDREVVRTDIVVDDLEARAEAADISLRHLAMAVHVRAIAEVFGELTIVTGVTANGRLEREGGIEARGMFLNMIPLQLEATADPIATARACARIDAAMTPHRRLPNVDITSATGKGPLFDFGFNFVRFHRLAEIEETHTFGSKDTDSHFSQEDTDFALMATFSIHPPEHRLALMVIVDAARVSPARHRRIISAYTSASRWAATPDQLTTGESNR